MEFLVIAAIIGVIPANIAKNKGYNFGTWWFYGFMLFIFALPHALVLTPNQAGIEKAESAAGKRRCPRCAEFIQSAALLCRHCGLTLEPTSTAPIDSAKSADPRRAVKIFGIAILGGLALAAILARVASLSG